MAHKGLYSSHGGKVAARPEGKKVMAKRQRRRVNNPFLLFLVFCIID